ncbi:MAG: hypothetical protein NT121_12650 [Chloroflexi bacterium]|nr:hypothetical protein [Chloroflexota bacterium]
MKNLKNSLHILLTFASVIGFLGGWATFAHSRKPIQPVTAQPLALEPLTPLTPLRAIDGSSVNMSDNNSNWLLNLFTPVRRTRSSRAMFATRGS